MKDLKYLYWEEDSELLKTKEDAEVFFEALANPPKPTEEAKKICEQYKEMINSGKLIIK